MTSEWQPDKFRCTFGEINYLIVLAVVVAKFIQAVEDSLLAVVEDSVLAVLDVSVYNKKFLVGLEIWF
jgi:hypothetical protein